MANPLGRILDRKAHHNNRCVFCLFCMLNCRCIYGLIMFFFAGSGAGVVFAATTEVFRHLVSASEIRAGSVHPKALIFIVFTRQSIQTQAAQRLRSPRNVDHDCPQREGSGWGSHAAEARKMPTSHKKQCLWLNYVLISWGIYIAVYVENGLVGWLAYRLIA